MLAVAVSLLLAGALSWAMARGADPALRPKAIAAASTAPQRRIVKTVVIKRVVGSSTSTASGPSASVVSAPVASAPAPVTSGVS